MPSKSRSRTLTDHDEIRRWAEERDARPSVVRSTHEAENTGIIRLDFPGYSGEGSLEKIEWDEWFDDFDRRKLALIVQDQTAEGEQSNFNKLVSRESIQDYSDESSERNSRKKATKRTGETNRKGSTTSKTKASSKSASSTGAGTNRKKQHSQRSSKKKAA